ncbi:hypothetical protein BKH35_06135 [Actinomyces naeslundii]|uniref:hypothetical protein n=1 Tax=Actinomyces naeslundii TaxID=1655 RepID=UPI00096DAB27|nr:hypothetical protein [Actinomyces naeslundii]OMG29230.1 hypothetical protein BKH35_06135 [Actinomyces naeslundii]OMG40680.1 hypothetical protein BKH14_02595 [Actinomyces naeslundii]
MHYAQRLLAALPSTRLGARAILAVLTAFGIILTTAGVAAMPLLNEGNAVEESEGGAACRPAARMVYPEGQSAPEYVVPVYETGNGVGVESILSDWCDAAGEVLENPDITLNVVEGKTVTPHLLPGIHAELERPAPANGEQDVFIPTDYLVKGMRQATGDNTWDVGRRVYSLTFTSGTVSATTGMFSFVKQDPDIVNPPSPEPTTEPSAEPSAEPTPQPTAEPTSEPESTTEPTNEPTAAPTTGPSAEPAPEPTQTPTPTPSATPSSEPTATATPTHSATPAPTPTSSASPTNTTCQVAPTASVLTPDGAEPKGTEPVYDPEVAVRVSGTGWCSQGTMLDGEKSVEIKMMAHGGYAVPGTVSVPVTFHNGSFSAQLNLSALYTAGKAERGRYYLQISPIETGLTAGTNVFVLNKSVTPQPAPTPTAGPTAEPSSSPAPEPSPAPSARPTNPKPDSESATDTSGGNVPSNRGSSSGGQSDTGNSSDGSDRSDSSDRSDADAPPADVPAEPGADQGRAQDSDHRSNSDTSANEDSRASTQADAGTAASEDRTVRPTANPVAPVSSSAQLSADNAGSLSGSRQGNVVNLVLPKAKVSAGEWVSVFVFPGATTKGWVQVDDANSVSIDISTFESGSYELAVADRDNSLLGWAKLEITSASFDPRSPAQAQLLTFPDDDSSTPMGLSTNDMLLGGAGGLLVIGAGSLLVAAHSGIPLRVPHASRRPRIPRRR